MTDSKTAIKKTHWKHCEGCGEEMEGITPHHPREICYECEKKEQDNEEE